MSRMTTLCAKWGVALVAGIAVAISASPAQASLTVNLRLADGTSGWTKTPAEAAALVGTSIQIQVWATVTNDLAPGDNSNGTGDNEGLGFLAASLKSHVVSPGIQGDLRWFNNSTTDTSANRNSSLVGTSSTGPFVGQSSQGGARQDLNGDGIMDIGSDAGTSGTDVIRPRAPAAVWDYIPPDPVNGIPADTFPGSPDFLPPANTVRIRNVLPNGTEWLVARYQFRLTGANPGGRLQIGADIPSWILGAVPGANWWQDSSQIPSDQGNVTDGLNSGQYLAGSPISLNVIPEPSTLALAGLGLVSVILASRRRRG